MVSNGENMKINKVWHGQNRMPKNASDKERIQWHVDHARECGCRDIPPKIKTALAERKPKLVVAVLARNKDKYLLVKEKLEGGSEKWIIPGGKVEFGESLEEAAKRELAEEVGIKVVKVKFLAFWEAIFVKWNYHTVIFFYETLTEAVEMAEDIEGKVLEAKWFTREEIKNLKLVESAEWLFDRMWK